MFIALYDKPSIFFSEFWIDNIKATELGITDLPRNIKLEHKYKVEKLGFEPFEFNKEGLAFGISDFLNRVTRELGKKNQTYIINNHILNMSGDRNIEIKKGNYNENIQGDYYEQSGNFGIGQMSGGEIQEGVKVAGVINEAEQKQTLAEAAVEIQKLLKQLEQTNPTATVEQQQSYVDVAVSPTLKAKFVSALSAGWKEMIVELLDNSYVNVGVAILEGWQDTE